MDLLTILFVSVAALAQNSNDTFRPVLPSDNNDGYGRMMQYPAQPAPDSFPGSPKDPLRQTRIPTCGGNDKNTALMIIDMQDTFALRGKRAMVAENAAAIAKVVEQQRRAIELAKKAHQPIIMVEFANFGPTTSVLKEALAGYDRVTTVLKSTDGVFDPANIYKGQLANALTKDKVKHLVVAGANGGACVESTIEGALASNCDVLSFGDGIADFNYRKFITPYRYGGPQLQQFNVARSHCFGCTFNQVKSEEEIRPALTGSGDFAPADGEDAEKSSATH